MPSAEAVFVCCR